MLGKFLEALLCFVVFIFFPVGCLGLLAVETIQEAQPCIESHEVVSIGGCSRSGCGVVLSNGKKDVVPYPVIGQQVCVKKKAVW